MERRTMNVFEDILRSLGHIEGELVEIRKPSERVARLEMRLSWLKGAWAVATSLFLWKAAFGH
jgi:hypothetical protein